jgi:hypothetical protein
MNIEKVNILPPTDAVYVPENNSLVFLIRDNQNSYLYKTYLYSLTDSLLTDSLFIESNYYSGYAGLVRSVYNGSTDIYCWFGDYLYLINPSDFQIINSKNFTEIVEDVTSDNNAHVFVSTYYDYIYSLGRNGLNTISTVNVYGTGYLFYYQEQLLSIERSDYPELEYIAVDNTGRLTEQSSGWMDLNELTGDFDPENGTVVNYSGGLYSFDLNYIGSLGISPSYLSKNHFYFDTEGSQIYYNDYTNKEIKVYSSENYQYLRSLTTLGWPERLLLDKYRNIIVISSTSEDYANSILIERF